MDNNNSNDRKRGRRGDLQDDAGRSRAAARLLHGRITDSVLGAYYRVYRRLGYGFVDSVYQNSLLIELLQSGVQVHSEVPMHVTYGGKIVGYFKADLVVDNLVLVELKAAVKLDASHVNQVYNYLKASGLQVALLLNFGPAPTFKRLVVTNATAENFSVLSV